VPVGIPLLVFILTVWNPASVTLQAASALPNLETRSTLSLAFLSARLIVASIGLGGGAALWLRRPGALALAKVSLVLFAVEAVARLATRIDLDTTPPGTRLPLALFVIGHNAAWYLYLQRSGRVRQFYGLESQSRSGDIRFNRT
jgi:hypothetical protein